MRKDQSKEDATFGGLRADPVDRPKLLDHIKTFVAYHEHL